MRSPRASLRVLWKLTAREIVHDDALAPRPCQVALGGLGQWNDGIPRGSSDVRPRRSPPLRHRARRADPRATMSAVEARFFAAGVQVRQADGG